MKKIIRLITKAFFVNILTLLSMTSITLAQGSPLTNLKIDITGLRSGSGGVELMLFDKNHATDFPTKPDAAISRQYLELNNKKEIQFIVPKLPAGEYAAFAYHDENSDHNINTNLIGIPKEGYGASQKAKNRFGPPKYADARFIISASDTESTSIQVQIDY